jgi:polar amino acid transport system substrate-binding protein
MEIGTMRTWLVPLALLASMSAPRAAVELATFPIPVHVESDTRGLFVELTREIARATGHEVSIQVMPPPRAVRGYAEGGYAGLFPALDINFAPGQPITRTAESLDCKEDFVFTRKGAPFLKALDDLQGKRVGITRGYPYARDVTDSKAYSVEAAPSDEANIRKLMAGHLDAFVLDEKTGVKAFEALGLAAQMQYDPTLPVSRQDVYYAFQDTAAGKSLAAEFSQALAQMKADGRYQSITRGITMAGGCPQSQR